MVFKPAPGGMCSLIFLSLKDPRSVAGAYAVCSRSRRRVLSRWAVRRVAAKLHFKNVVKHEILTKFF